MKQYTVTVNGTAYQVAIEETNNTQTTPTHFFSPTPDARPAATQNAPISNPANSDSGSINAPLPGIIQKIFVNEGDSVTAGTNILSLEAMKMENEIKASHNGTIKKIHVKVGEQVETGTILIDIE